MFATDKEKTFYKIDTRTASM